MRLSDLAGCRVAVWGAGRDGRAAVEVLVGRATDLVLVTDRPEHDHGARSLAQEHGLELVAAEALGGLAVDAMVRSPGVSRYRPEVLALTARGVPSANLLALWLADQPPARVVGITGTKGKSTTSAFAHALALAAGVPAALAGNIGVPVTHADPAAPLVVLEVSSYQASDVTVSPGVGVLTSLGVDHLPWHGSVERYHADKLNLFAHPGLRVLVHHADQAHVLVDAGIPLRPDTTAWWLDGKVLRCGDEVVPLGPSLSRGQLPRNALVAVRAVEAWGRALPAAQVAEVAAAYQGLPSRQRVVAEVDGVTWVDDALASNPLGCANAVEAFADGPLVLILGGEDRGVDVDDLAALLRGAPHVAGVVLVSATGPRLAAALAGAPFPVRLLHTDDVAAAVPVAAHVAPAGATVVFSPAAPTPAHLGTYEQRSAAFAAAVRARSR